MLACFSGWQPRALIPGGWESCRMKFSHRIYHQLKSEIATMNSHLSSEILIGLATSVITRRVEEPRCWIKDRFLWLFVDSLKKKKSFSKSLNRHWTHLRRSTVCFAWTCTAFKTQGFHASEIGTFRKRILAGQGDFNLPNAVTEVQSIKVYQWVANHCNATFIQFASMLAFFF